MQQKSLNIFSLCLNLQFQNVLLKLPVDITFTSPQSFNCAALNLNVPAIFVADISVNVTEPFGTNPDLGKLASQPPEA